MGLNIQHSTAEARPAHAQHPRLPRQSRVGRWALGVECSAFLFLTFFAAAQSATNALPSLAPAYGVLPPTFWERYGTAILMAWFTFAILAAMFFWVIIEARTPLVVPPDILACRALEKLRQQQPENGNVLSEISQILRRYIATAFEFPSGELTTVEFSAALAASQKTGPELARNISDFLRECDRRKFSPANPGAPLNAVDRALQLVAQVQTISGNPQASKNLGAAAPGDGRAPK